MSVGDSGLQASPDPSLGCIDDKRKFKEHSTVLFLKFSNFEVLSPFFSFHPTEFSYHCLLYYVHGVWSYLVGKNMRNRKRNESGPSYLEPEVLVFVFLISVLGANTFGIIMSSW